VGVISPIYLLKPRFFGLINRWKGSSTAAKTTYVFFAVLGLLFWSGLLVGSIKVISLFDAVEVFGPLLIRKLLEVLLLSIFAMLLFSSVVTAVSTFYLSEDLNLLMGLPIARPVLHYGRLIESAVQSSWMMGMFGLPIFLAYGIVLEADLIYYACLAVVVPSVLLIPASIGVMVASVLVNVFPARRAREVMGIVGILFVVVVFLFLRLVRPEQLVNAEGFDSLAGYIASMQAPMPDLLPPSWAANVLQDVLRGREVPVLQLGMLLTCTMASVAASRWVTAVLLDGGWSKSQEARGATLVRNKRVWRFVRMFTDRLPSDVGPVIEKDIRIFFRDPAQWSQIFLLASLIVIYLFSVSSLPVDVVRGAYMQSFKDALAYLNLGMAGFVMAGIAVRFQFTAISGEGRAFWLMQSGPVDPKRFLWAKVVPGLLPMLFVGETLVLASNAILSSPPSLVVIEGLTVLILAFGISGIAGGVGAYFPDFKADNAAKAAAGPGGILFMVLSLSLVFLVLVIEAIPVWYILRQNLNSIPLTPREMLITGLCFSLSILVCWLAAVLPIRRASVDLWERN